MANKKKSNPLALMGYEIDNKSMSGMRKKKATIASPVSIMYMCIISSLCIMLLVVCVLLSLYYIFMLHYIIYI